MQFNQTNQNEGNVNNAVSERGSVVQSIGGIGNKNTIEPPKSGFWGTLFGKLKSLWKWIFGLK